MAKATINFGWDIDGVLHSCVSPLQPKPASRNSVGEGGKCKDEGSTEFPELNDITGIIKQISLMKANVKHYAISSNTKDHIDKVIKELGLKDYFDDSRRLSTKSTAKTKLQLIQENNINFFFDDSNLNLNEVLEAISTDKKYSDDTTPLKDNCHAIKVFPETINDVYDKKAGHPNSGNGTNNPLFVEIDYDDDNIIDVLSYNIAHEITRKIDTNHVNKLKNIYKILNKYVKREIHIIALQESTIKLGDFDKGDGNGTKIDATNYDEYSFKMNKPKGEQQHTYFLKNRFHVFEAMQIGSPGRPVSIFVVGDKKHLKISGTNDDKVDGYRDLFIFINAHFNHTDKTTENIFKNIKTYFNDNKVDANYDTTTNFNKPKFLGDDKSYLKDYDTLIKKIKTHRVILAGDLNRDINVNSDHEECSDKEDTSRKTPRSNTSCYGMKIFPDDGNTILYNYYGDGNAKDSAKTQKDFDLQVDNILDSYGLQFKIDIFPIKFENGSDHKPIYAILYNYKHVVYPSKRLLKKNPYNYFNSEHIHGNLFTQKTFDKDKIPKLLSLNDSAAQEDAGEYLTNVFGNLGCFADLESMSLYDSANNTKSYYLTVNTFDNIDEKINTSIHGSNVKYEDKLKYHLTSLVRIKKSGKTTSKDDTRINLNNTIDTRKTTGNVNFYLAAAIVHTGDASGGHYVIYIFYTDKSDSDAQKYVKISDNSVEGLKNGAYEKASSKPYDNSVKETVERNCVMILHRKDQLKESDLPKIYGIENTGNSCYLNASLQLLYLMTDVKDEINRLDMDKIKEERYNELSECAIFNTSKKSIQNLNRLYAIKEILKAYDAATATTTIDPKTLDINIPDYNSLIKDFYYKWNELPEDDSNKIIHKTKLLKTLYKDILEPLELGENPYELFMLDPWLVSQIYFKLIDYAEITFEVKKKDESIEKHLILPESLNDRKIITGTLTEEYTKETKKLLRERMDSVIEAIVNQKSISSTPGPTTTTTTTPPGPTPEPTLPEPIRNPKMYFMLDIDNDNKYINHMKTDLSSKLSDAKFNDPHISLFHIECKTIDICDYLYNILNNDKFKQKVNKYIKTYFNRNINVNMKKYGESLVKDPANHSKSTDTTSIFKLDLTDTTIVLPDKCDKNCKYAIKYNVEDNYIKKIEGLKMYIIKLIIKSFADTGDKIYPKYISKNDDENPEYLFFYDEHTNDPQFYIHMYDIEHSLLRYHISIITDNVNDHTNVKTKYDKLLNDTDYTDTSTGTETGTKTKLMDMIKNNLKNITNKDIIALRISTSKGNVSTS